MVGKALLVRGDPYGIPQALFFSLGDFTNLPQWKQFCHYLIHTHTYQHTVVFVFVLKKKTSPHFQPALDHSPLGQARRRGRNRGSGVATGSAFHLQEPPPSSYSSFPSSLPHYSWKNGGLCSSHQLIPVECSRHGAYHSGQLTTNPLFTELAVEMGMWNIGHWRISVRRKSQS